MVFYPSLDGTRMETRNNGEKTKCLIAQSAFGKFADKICVLNFFAV